jgi:uroporphyrinogen decarboxylase
MTNRERMRITLNHEVPDRIPSTMYARGEVQRALMRRFGAADFDAVLDLLGARLYKDVSLKIRDEEFDSRTNRLLEGDLPYAGNRFIFHDERTFEDQWGVIRRVGRDWRYVQHISGPLCDESRFSGYRFPVKEQIEGERELSERIVRLKEQDLFVRAYIPNPYKTAWYLRGMENLLSDYILEPEFVEKLYEKIYRFYTEMLQAYTRAGVDMIAIEGDIAMQDRILVGAERWRVFDKPVLKQLIDDSKAVNPDVSVFFHSDGDLTEVLGDLIEIGFTVIDSMQPECMDLAAVKREYGDRMVLHGCGSLQQVLPFGTVQDCRDEVLRLIEQCGYNGGLVLRPSNMIGPDVPTENIIAWFETVRDTPLGQFPADA